MRCANSPRVSPAPTRIVTADWLQKTNPSNAKLWQVMSSLGVGKWALLIGRPFFCSLNLFIAPNRRLLCQLHSGHIECPARLEDRFRQA